MNGAMTRWLWFLASALLLACEPVGPEVEDATSADAADVHAQPDVANDVAAPNDSVPADAADADSGVSDAIAADMTADATPVADAADAADDALADAVPDTQPDAAADAAPDVPMGMDMSFDAGDIAGLPVSPTNIDVIGIAFTCTDTAWQSAVCGPGVTLDPPELPGYHVDLPYAITYADAPPTSGTHRPMWGKFGEYVFMPEQRWLHNAEHGAIAFLYNPCAPSATIDALRTFLKAQPADNSGPFRWILTPYPGLPSTIAAVSWGHVYKAACVQPDELNAFILAHYRKAPEDESAAGPYDELWLGNWP
jgi:hypothetical protein